MGQTPAGNYARRNRDDYKGKKSGPFSQFSLSAREGSVSSHRKKGLRIKRGVTFCPLRSSLGFDSVWENFLFRTLRTFLAGPLWQPLFNGTPFKLFHAIMIYVHVQFYSRPADYISQGKTTKLVFKMLDQRLG